MHADPYDYLPPPEEAVLTFQKGNMKSPLCKEITIVDDCDAEMLEEFKVGLELVEAECAKVQFHPNYTTVKITDDDAPKGNIILLLIYIIPIVYLYTQWFCIPSRLVFLTGKCGSPMHSNLYSPQSKLVFSKFIIK